MSRYQARLFRRSFTVREAHIDRARRDSGLARLSAPDGTDESVLMAISSEGCSRDSEGATGR
jgi:hypothetical protein